MFREIDDDGSEKIEKSELYDLIAKLTGKGKSKKKTRNRSPLRMNK